MEFRSGFIFATVIGTMIMCMVTMITLGLDESIDFPSLIFVPTYCVMNFISAVLTAVYVGSSNVYMILFFFICFAILLVDFILYMFFSPVKIIVNEN